MFTLSSTFKCRRKELLRYFGEHYSKVNCQSCDNCLEDTEVVDESIPAQMVLSCVYRLQERFGITHVVDVLRGSKNASVLAKGHDKLSTYGLMPERSESDLRYLILSLLDLGYLQRSEGEYPVLKWTAKSREVTHKKEKVFIRKKIEVERAPIFKGSKNYDKALFEVLSAWRDRYAVKTNVPPYVVMGEQLLIEIAAKCPLSKEKFLQLNGFGPIQWDKYGTELLELLKNYSGFTVIAQAKPKRQESSLETVRLFQEGVSVAQIANRRQITVATVLAHLGEQIAAGMDLDITPIVSKVKQEAINKVLEKLGAEKLKPIKEALPEEYTYEEIRLVTAFKRL